MPMVVEEVVEDNSDEQEQAGSYIRSGSKKLSLLRYSESESDSDDHVTGRFTKRYIDSHLLASKFICPF